MFGTSTLLVAEPVLGEAETAALAEVIARNWVTMGPQVRAFEEAFAALHGVADAVAVNSCTAGLHLALAALGIGPGDEVIVPSLSFVATANCVHYTGAVPVFADIESLDRPLISVESAEALVTPRTRAVIVMHYGGALVDAASWRDFAARHGLYLIEDSAHAVGSARGPLIGDVAVFSFYGNKNMTTAEGGMIIAADPALLEHMRRGRAHGMTSTTAERLQARAATYDVTSLGFNYRMSELNAALGLVQLPRLDDWNRRRAALAACYAERLRDAGPIVALSGHSPSANHLMAAVLPACTDRARVMSTLTARGIQTSIHYPAIHTLAWYRQRHPGVSLPATEAFAARELTLPLHPKMDEKDVAIVADALLEALADQAAMAG